MSIVQLHLPENISVQQLSDEVAKLGGVVRTKKEQFEDRIVPDMQRTAAVAKRIAYKKGQQALDFVEDNKFAFILAGAGAAFLTVGAVSCIQLRNARKKHRDERRLSAALKKYVAAAEKGEFDKDAASEVILYAEILRRKRKCKSVSVRLSSDELDSLICRIFEDAAKAEATEEE